MVKLFRRREGIGEFGFESEFAHTDQAARGIFEQEDVNARPVRLRQGQLTGQIFAQLDGKAEHRTGAGSLYQAD